MQEIVYKLVKEDYQDWIHWNVKKNYSEKARKKTVVVFIALVAAFVISGIFLNKNISATIPTLVLGIGGGMYILRTTSMEGQEKMLWKRTGLARLEKSGNYPVIHLQLKNRGLSIRVENQEMEKDWGYKEIVGIEETDRLFLLEAADKTWQFIAKSGFESRTSMDSFLTFMQEKIAAAKEDPESYTTEAMELEASAPEAAVEGESSEAAEGTAAAGDVSGSEEEDGTAKEQEAEVVIEHVDTSNMGKIGKMAHIMAAMAAEEAAEVSTEAAEEAAEVSTVAAEEAAEVSAEAAETPEQAEGAETE